MTITSLRFDRSKTMAAMTSSFSCPRIPVQLALCGLACLTLLASGCGSSTKAISDDPANAPHAPVVKVVRQNLTNSLQIAADFEPFQEINVYAKVSGYIQRLYIDWGTHVNQGQLLAVLEIPELQQQLQLDEAAVRRSGQDLARTNEELIRAQSDYSVTHLTYTRLADVQKTRSELIAQQEIDIAHGRDLEANAGVLGAKDAVSGSEQALIASKATLEKDKAMFAYARISAPFNGVITEMDAFTGSLLPAGTSSNKGDQALCRLSQNDLLRLVIPLPERAVADVHLGETVAVRVSTNNKNFNGKIARFSDQIDTGTRTMHTEIDVPNPKYELVPGMYATANIPLHTAQNVLTVPLQAIQISGEDRGTVLVVGPGNKIERRDVKLGLQNATYTEVTSGLEEDDLVVFGEQSQYKPSELVVPQIVTPAGME
jgi:RND family efflux transporter MFP subunit